MKSSPEQHRNFTSHHVAALSSNPNPALPPYRPPRDTHTAAGATSAPMSGAAVRGAGWTSVWSHATASTSTDRKLIYSDNHHQTHHVLGGTYPRRALVASLPHNDRFTPTQIEAMLRLQTCCGVLQLYCSCMHHQR